MNDGRKSLEALTPAETRDRAREYRLLAATAPTGEVREALLRLARMLEYRAAEREAQDADRAHGERGAFATGYADGRSVLHQRPKSGQVPAAPFRTAYEAGYDRGRNDAGVIATQHRMGLRRGQVVGAVPAVTDHL